jgi:hypothetical protein
VELREKKIKERMRIENRDTRASQGESREEERGKRKEGEGGRKDRDRTDDS